MDHSRRFLRGDINSAQLKTLRSLPPPKAFSTSARTIVRLLFLTTVVAVRAAEPAGSGPQTTLVAPGIWRVHFGNPESFTPVHFQSAPMDKAALKTMPYTQPMPVDQGKISFHRSDRGCSVLLPMKSGESIYGLGLGTTLFDLTQGKNGQSGRHVFLKPTDAPENELGESHAPAPFYVSSKGYGVFIDTARFASFYTGDDSPAPDAIETEGGAVKTGATNRSRGVKTMLVDVPVAKGLDIYVFAGPTMLDAVKRYNLFSGGGVVPPLWGLGVQYRGHAKLDADETLALATRLRADHIPCDVWGIEPGWQSKAYSCSFVWNSNNFPHPDGFLQKMRGLDYHLNFWEHAFTHPSSPIYNELKPWAGNYFVWGGLVPDFASPEGRQIFLQQQNGALFDHQVEGVKLDECDYQPESPAPWSFPLNTAFPSGLDGEQMHSLFGLLYQQAMLEPYRKKGLRTWGLVRNSHALASSLPYVVYSDSYDHHCYVRGLANEGFGGLLWTPEVRDAASLEDFYRRLETVIFSPDALINSWFIRNPPWYQINREKNNRGEFMPERAAATDDVRQLLQLRMSFIPYLYSAFNEYRTTGKPPIRALVLDWPEDPKVRQIDNQFMFGDSVMVAPMFAGQNGREVYLPAGDWYDYWTREKCSGGKTITATNGVKQIPLFVKAGTLLPLAEAVECVKPGTCFKITVNIVGPNPSDFMLYEDDGVTTAYARGEQNKVKLHAWGDSHSVQRSGNYHGPDRFKIAAWQQF
jgi:alpha-D-xyloside xylohydrolase